jgi:hypothetical protein
MIRNKNFLVIYKMLFGLLGVSALVTEIVVLIDRGRFVPANFFSFFTVESNLFAATMLLVSGAALLWNKSFKYLAMLRGAAALYMVTTGIAFSILLSGLEADVLTAVPWDNMVLHYILPAAVFVDWVLDPPRSRITFKRAAVWLVYPITYLVYSLVRGSIVDWYPYPFLNPATHGYAGVAVVGVGIAATVLAITSLLVRFTRKTKPA